MSACRSRIRVGLLFGGRSGEHEVSVTSARCVLEAIDREKYEVVPIRISRNGRWAVLPPLGELESLDNLERLSGGCRALSPWGEGGQLVSAAGMREDPGAPLDVVFPLLHGVFGEDGTVQGLLALADVASVGAGVSASALGMDKVLQKQLFQQAGLKVPAHWAFPRKQWQRQPEEVAGEIEGRFGYPCFVKPANTGSSVGISKAHDRQELTAAIDQAAGLDLKVLVEQAIDARELECGVLGNEEPEASVVGEVISCHEFYDYEAKYIAEGTQIIIPAEIEPQLSRQVQEWAIRAFQAIDACGMARVDFFLERGTDQLYVNEINTIPGFTPRSMFPRLWQTSGLSYRQLIDRLMELALERHRERRKTQGYEETDGQ